METKLHYFQDDYSCYGYLYLIHEKSKSLDMLKAYIDEVENQVNMKIKNIRYNRGGKYYGRYDGLGAGATLEIHVILDVYHLFDLAI